MQNSAGGAESAAFTPLQRLLRRFVQIEPREIAAVVAAFFLFFFVLGSYFAVRPVRETVATLIGRKEVADLWLFTAAFSLLIVPLYGWLVARVRRSVLLPCIYGAVAVILVLIGTALDANEQNHAVGKVFYVWISVLNLLLVSVFWSFLLEIFSSEQARRLFGFVAAGGTFGALVGPGITRLLVGEIGNAGVLYLGAAGFIGAIFCQRILLTAWGRGGLTPVGADAPAREDRGLGGNPFAGIVKVVSSPYLLGIALFVVFISLVNTFLYFEQLRIVEETYRDTTRRTEVFANIDFLVQSLTVISQLFLTGWIASRLGVRVLLTIVPVVLVAGFLAIAAFGTILAVGIAMVLRRWGEYAFVRPGREMLWSRLDTETKYKAKNFVDVPVYRAADFAGAQAKTGLEALGMSAAGAALLGAAIAVGWAVNGWWLGRRHDADKSE
jgi:AAA family ATP:ADP antiporter